MIRCNPCLLVQCHGDNCKTLKAHIAECRELIKDPAYRQKLIDDFDDFYEQNKQSDARQG